MQRANFSSFVCRCSLIWNILHCHSYLVFFYFRIYENFSFLSLCSIFLSLFLFHIRLCSIDIQMRWLHVRFDVKWPVQHRSGLSIRAHIFLKWNQNVHTSLAHILRSETYHMGDVVLFYGFFFRVCMFVWLGIWQNEMQKKSCAFYSSGHKWWKSETQTWIESVISDRGEQSTMRWNGVCKGRVGPKCRWIEMWKRGRERKRTKLFRSTDKSPTEKMKMRESQETGAKSRSERASLAVAT